MTYPRVFQVPSTGQTWGWALTTNLGPVCGHATRQLGEVAIDLVWIVIPPPVAVGVEPSWCDSRCYGTVFHLSLDTAGPTGNRFRRDRLEHFDPHPYAGAIFFFVGVLPDEVGPADDHREHRPTESFGDSERPGAKCGLDADQLIRLARGELVPLSGFGSLPWKFRASLTDRLEAAGTVIKVSGAEAADAKRARRKK